MRAQIGAPGRALDVLSRNYLRTWGFLHNAPKRFNPGSRRQTGIGFDRISASFPNNFGYIGTLWLFTKLVAPV
jgi:hypothetical protein